ncbi:MAG: SGNH/GDSL hydrolase family protein [Cyanobacteriota bacterium]|nr:SGNH/GDSL hydrolase family protein [Cyanobacteriota bacterium]
MKSILIILLAAIAFLVILVEVGLRLLLGFGNPPLYIADEKIGYLLAPNQRLRRMGNCIEVNEYSMRGASVTAKRPPETLRVLLLGDSVANGGWWTDGEQTISYLLQEKLEPSQPGVEVLNASANSWSPRNELAYVQRFGLFEAQIVVLLINTDDLFGTAPTSLPVGRDRNYPQRKPKGAIAELYSRYFVKPQPVPGMDEVRAEGGDRVGYNLQAIEDIETIARSNGATLILAMTPLLREIGEPGSRDYELKARQRLKEFTSARSIPYIDFLPLFEGQTAPKTLYRDHIHLSPTGNQFVCDRLVTVISNQ